MRRRSTAICLALAALVPAAAPAAAPAKKAKVVKPTITRVTPMRIRVGAVLTIQGKNFKAKKSRNTVIFRASNGRTAFAKPMRSSRRKLVVRVPAALSRVLAGKPGRIKIRVLAGKFSAFTPRRLSPVVVPPGFSSGIGGGGGATLACSSTFDDGDLLPAAKEAEIGTDRCVADTDGDKVEDGFEFRSALDLNNDEYQAPNDSLPYPGKRPYPNALDPSDGRQDYDGDSLSQAVEQMLWKFSTSAPRSLSALSYSDGLQYSVYEHRAGQGDRRFPALSANGYTKQVQFENWATANGYRYDVYVFGAAPYDLFDVNLDGTETPTEGRQFDRDGDTFLSDDERDEDADGLSNFDENTGRLHASTWWSSCYTSEKPYYVKYAGTSITDRDSDGDGVRDGADDQDHDDLPNLMELSRVAAYNDSGASYGYDPMEGDGDDREQGADCKLAKAIRDLLEDAEPPIYWHQSAYGRVNPFNPCLPAKSSRTCKTIVDFGAAWAPFDDSPDWFALN